jgi:hypothetical protein
MQVQVLDSWQRASGSNNATTTTSNITNPTSTVTANTTNNTATSIRGTSSNNRTDQLFTELRQLIDHSGRSSPVRDAAHHELLDFPQFGLFAPTGKMPPKKSGRAMLREEGKLFNDVVTCMA